MKVNFKVDGMSCSACSAAVEKAVGRVQGVQSVAVSLLDGRMICVPDGPDIIEKVTAAVGKAGFTATCLPDGKQDVKQPARYEKYPAESVLGVFLQLARNSDSGRCAVSGI